MSKKEQQTNQSSRVDRAAAILGRALQLSSLERDAYLQGACAADAGLRKEVEAMLQAHEEAGDFLAAPTANEDAATIPSFPTEKPGAIIDRYKLLELIGEGGFGTVYLAEQTEPVRRQVALKIIKLGMDTKQVIARFEAERQALAMMDHPNVAKVFDAGSTETGRPYFVMELVKGVSITEHCDRQRLNIQERLELFMQVCEAVQHAHQKAIIHRDLKPTNILVSLREGKPLVKVIDFGIAKAISHRLTEKTIYTEHGQLIGTPEYMSPEQAEMTAQDIDTRSDIYSLGVLLYELLTGALPFDPRTLRQAAFGEIQRIIREQEPPKPSTKLSSLGDTSTTNADNRRLDPRSLRRELRGDLDWIVMKALEKDRQRRYETANALAMDLQRHLTHEPVLAGPPSAAYRTRKFVRRHKVGVAAAILVAMALVVGAAGTTWQSVRATNAEQRALALADSESEQRRLAEVRQGEAESQRREADRQAAIAHAVNRFLNDDLLAAVDPDRDGRDVTVREVLDKASEKIDTAFADQPEVEAAVRTTIGSTYRSLGLYDEAEMHLRAAVVLHRRPPGVHDLVLAATLIDLWVVLWRKHEYADAEDVAREAYEIRRSRLGEDHIETQGALKYLLSTRRALGAAAADEAHDEMVYRLLVTLLPEVTTAEEARAFVEAGYEEVRRLWAAGDREGAQALIRQFLEPFLLMPGIRGAMPSVVCGVAEILAGRGDRPLAESGWRVALALGREIQGEDDPGTLHITGHLAKFLHEWGELEEAEALQRKALEGKKRVLGEKHPDTLVSMANLARLLHDTGATEEAEALLAKAVELLRTSLRKDHPNTLTAMNNLGRLYKDLGRFDEAETLLLEVYEIAASAPEPDDERITRQIGVLAHLYDAWHEAEPGQGYDVKAAQWRAKLSEGESANEQDE